MTNCQYLIIGGGMTAAAAVEGIREVDSTGGIGLIGAELDAPYDRPPLSKVTRTDTRPKHCSSREAAPTELMHKKIRKRDHANET
jgi:NAD(P)H-nitrite reductase large subunit